MNGNITLFDIAPCSLEEENAKETSKRIPTIAFLAVFMVIGILGNLILIIVYFGTLRRRQRAHWTFIRALAIVDFLVCTFVIPFEIFQQTHQLTFYTEIYCQVFRSFTVYSTVVSAFLMIAVSSDRLRMICWPLSRQLSSNQALMIVAFVLCLSVVFTWPEGALSGISLEDTDCNVTGYDCSFADMSPQYTTAYSGVLFSLFLVCMLTLIIMYSMIGYRVFRKAHTSAKKVTKIAFVISFCFVLSYIPYSVIKLNGAVKKGIFRDSRLPDVLYHILARTFIINNVVNPFVYAFLDSTFREHCIHLFKCTKPADEKVLST